MSNSTLAAMSLFGGSYSLDASTASELGTVQTDLEQVTASMYTVSQRRLDYGLSITIPAMTSVLKADNTLACMLVDATPAYQLFGSGVATAAAIAANTTIREAQAAFSSSRRLAFLRQTERVILKLASVTATAMLVVRGAAYEDWRTKRDTALSYLMGDIETATLVRGLADDMSKIGTNGIVTGAKEVVSQAVHSMSMKQIEWERAKTQKSYSDAAASDRGGLLASIVQGVTDGYSDAKGGT